MFRQRFQRLQNLFQDQELRLPLAMWRFVSLRPRSARLQSRGLMRNQKPRISLTAQKRAIPQKRGTPQQLVMAALAVAEQLTNAETPGGQVNERKDETKAGDANISTPRVALLIARPDLKSASALKGLNVAIDAGQSAAEQDIRSALAAVGATDAQLQVSDVSPLDRLISGDVQAAVVKLVSADAADAFPDVKGFKVFRVPLSPH